MIDVQEISQTTLETNYASFLRSVNLHGWHRTVVKHSLTAYLRELLAGRHGSEADKMIAAMPYNKVTYWERIFFILVEDCGYLHSNLHTINSGITGRIQSDEYNKQL